MEKSWKINVEKEGTPCIGYYSLTDPGGINIELALVG